MRSKWGGTDVAFVTNIDVEEKYKQLFEANGIKILKCAFDSFKFPDDYQWCLAFYKLCALKFASTLDYDNVLCIDADTYCRGSFEYLWGNLKHNIILYDRAGSTVEPIDDLKKINFERYMYNGRIQKVGGEFFASSTENLKLFIKTAEEIFEKMMQGNIKTISGDEYITSLTAGCLPNIDYSGIRYIYRFETGFWREVCNKGQLSVTPILHVPCSKKTGLIKVYDYFIANDSFPPEKTMYRWFHFWHRTPKHLVLAAIKGTLFNQ